MRKIHTARVALVYPLRKDGRDPHSATYNTTVLTREYAGGRYGLPGGTVRGQRINDHVLRKTAQRELEEELGLFVDLDDLVNLYEFEGRTRQHTIYHAQEVTPLNGTASINYHGNEIAHLGFFNAGRHRHIPKPLLERYIMDQSGLVQYARNLPLTRGLNLNTADPRSFQHFYNHRKKHSWNRKWLP